MEKRKVNSLVARIAGNICSGLAGQYGRTDAELVARCVKLARMIVTETENTEPDQPIEDHNG